MATNLLETLKRQITDPVIAQLANTLSIDTQSTSSAVSALLPTILGGIVHQAASPAGAEALDRSVSADSLDSRLLEHLETQQVTESAEALAAQNSGLVAMIFGDKAAMIIPIISKLTGVNADIISSLLPILTSIVLSTLGRQKQAAGLDTQGLASLVMSQREAVAQALPPGIADAAGLTAITPTANNHTANNTTASSGMGILKVLVPLAIVAVVGYGCYRYIFAGIRPSGEAGNIIVEPDPVLMQGEYSPENVARAQAAEEAKRQATAERNTAEDTATENTATEENTAADSSPEESDSK